MTWYPPSRFLPQLNLLRQFRLRASAPESAVVVASRRVQCLSASELLATAPTSARATAPRPRTAAAPTVLTHSLARPRGAAAARRPLLDVPGLLVLEVVGVLGRGARGSDRLGARRPADAAAAEGTIKIDSKGSARSSSMHLDRGGAQQQQATKISGWCASGELGKR
jgi:hypothetical protein